MFVWLLTRLLIVSAAFFSRSLKTKFLIQRRVDFLKAARFERCGFNELVSRASCEGLHSLSRILFFSEILENIICDPASTGFFEGRQIWELRFKRICSLGFLRGSTYIVRAAYFFLGRSLNTKSVI